MEVRLQKFLADSGIASRRKSEELISAGKISVNGKTVRELGTKINDKLDVVLYEGKRVMPSKKKIYLMLHKPEGFVTTVKDQFNRAAVTDLLHNVGERVFPVGRLDYDTSGLLILTNDGELTYKLTHPKHEIPKKYHAKLYGEPDLKGIRRFRTGIMIEGRMTKPAKIEVLRKDERFAYAEITITEGRNRQIRKMCEEIKHPVASLKRVALGDLTLGDLEKGKYRELTEKEIKYLKSL